MSLLDDIIEATKNQDTFRHFARFRDLKRLDDQVQAFNLPPAVSAYIKTLLDDADAGAAQTTLGISGFIKTLLDDADAAAARATLGLNDGIIIPVRENGGPVVSGGFAYLNTTHAPGTVYEIHFRIVATDGSSKVIRITHNVVSNAGSAVAYEDCNTTGASGVGITTVGAQANGANRQLYIQVTMGGGLNWSWSAIHRKIHP